MNCIDHRGGNEDVDRFRNLPCSVPGSNFRHHSHCRGDPIDLGVPRPAVLMSQQVSETRECKNCDARMEQLGKLPGMLTKPALKIFRCCECNEVTAEPTKSRYRRTASLNSQREPGRIWPPICLCSGWLWKHESGTWVPASRRLFAGPQSPCLSCRFELASAIR